jgi:hypothetical protein
MVFVAALIFSVSYLNVPYHDMDNRKGYEEIADCDSEFELLETSSRTASMRDDV